MPFRSLVRNLVAYSVHLEPYISNGSAICARIAVSVIGYALAICFPFLCLAYTLIRAYCQRQQQQQSARKHTQRTALRRNTCTQPNAHTRAIVLSEPCIRRSAYAVRERERARTCRHTTCGGCPTVADKNGCVQWQRRRIKKYVLLRLTFFLCPGTAATEVDIRNTNRSEWSFG